MEAFSLHPRTIPISDHLGIRRAVINGAKMTVTRYDLQGGAGFSQHRHPEEQITLVLEGSIVFEVEGAHHDLTEGGIIVIPAGAPHGAVAGQEGAKVACVVTPRRDGTSSGEVIKGI